MDFELVNNVKLNNNNKKMQPEFSNMPLNNENYEQQQQSELEQHEMTQQQTKSEENLQNEHAMQHQQQQQEQFVMPNKPQKSYKNKQQKQHAEQHNMQFDEQPQPQAIYRKSLMNQTISKDQRRKSPTQHQLQNEQRKGRHAKHETEQNYENSLNLNNNQENINSTTTINTTSSNARTKSMTWTNSNNKKQTTTVAITATPMNQYYNNNNNNNKNQLVEQQIQCHRTTCRVYEQTQSNKCQIANVLPASTISSPATTITTASSNNATQQLAAMVATATTTTTMTTIVTTSSASTSAVPKQIAAAVNETTTTMKTTINVTNNNTKNNNNTVQRGLSTQSSSSSSTTSAKQQTIAAALKKPATTTKEATTTTAAPATAIIAITTKDSATATTALVTTTAATSNIKDATTATTVASEANTTTTTTAQQPLMSLAPPVSSTITTTAPSWASLFADANKDANNVNNNYATNKTVNSNQINPVNNNNNNNSNTNNNNNNNNSSNNNKNSNSNKNTNTDTGSTHMLQENAATKKVIIKLKRYENLITNNNVTPISSIITPGAMSYAATSARGLANANAAAAKIIKSDSPVTVSKTVQTATHKVKLPRRPEQIDEWTHKYGDFLNKFKTDLQAISLRPRGLTNRSNYCYINCILQALVGCPPFYNLLKSIPKQAAVLSDVKTPTVNAMMHFVNNFTMLRGGGAGPLRTHNRKGGKDDMNNDLQSDPAFEPTDIYKLWHEGRAEHAEGRQEDAEEFLGYVLNQLNDEMMEVINLIGNKSNGAQNGQKYQTASEDGDDWQMICNNRNKVSFTRQTDFGRTPLSDIFRGELRSRLQREGEHPTDIVQPFFTLQLNIERAASVKEALEILVGRDQIEGVTGSKSKQEVQAWQQTTLEKLPIVLIMHLKWFDYRSDGCTKILKKVEIPVELKIDAKIMASKKYSLKQRSYRLFAVVYHDGQEATKGHYITDVYHTGYESWLRYDDNYVKPVSEHHVLSPTTPRVPYLLFYRRCDSLPMVTAAMSAKQQH